MVELRKIQRIKANNQNKIVSKTIQDGKKIIAKKCNKNYTIKIKLDGVALLKTDPPPTGLTT